MIKPQALPVGGNNGLGLVLGLTRWLFSTKIGSPSGATAVAKPMPEVELEVVGHCHQRSDSGTLVPTPLPELTSSCALHDFPLGLEWAYSVTQLSPGLRWALPLAAGMPDEGIFPK
jgi:hypothetical protein